MIMGFEKISQQNNEEPTQRAGFEDQTSKEGLGEKMNLQRAVLGKIVEGSGMGDKDILLWLEENGEAMSYLLEAESALIESFIDGMVDKEDFIKKLEETKDLLKNKTLH